MNKRLIVLAVAGAFGASGAAFAAPKDKGPGASVHGHVETVFTASEDSRSGTRPAEQGFQANGELNIGARVTDDVYVRADLDYNSRYGAADTVEIEQLFGAWRINDMAKIKVGRFNSPLGYEKQDAPYKTTISRSLISRLLDGQTDLYQNNLEGVAVGLNVGPAVVTLGVVSEIGGTAEESSFLAHVKGEVIPGLNLGLGMLTQEDVGDSANTPDTGIDPDINALGTFETLINFNADYSIDFNGVATTFFVDYLTAGEVLDNAYSVGAKARFGDFGATVRYDFADYDSDREDTAITVAANWYATDNVDFRVEWRNDEIEGTGASDIDDDSVLLSAVFKF